MKLNDKKFLYNKETDGGTTSTISSIISNSFAIFTKENPLKSYDIDALKEEIMKIVNVEKNDSTYENANMSADTPVGQMMNMAATTAKEYALRFLLSKEYRDAHQNGDIHIHDLDYYPSKTTTCVQYDLKDIFANGFWTKNGMVREPQTIQSYATLAAIVFQSHQNEQHGGQAIPTFDYFLAPGVLKSFRKNLVKQLEFILKLNNLKSQTNWQALIQTKINTIDLQLNKEAQLEISKLLNLNINQVKIAFEEAYLTTEKETFQAMEGFIHNLNTMHSRGGNQVVFSSINYGTDTSPEGRMVIRQILLATQKGLGKNETPIFPIQIFKVKAGISYSEEDFNLAINNWKQDEKGLLNYKTKNFDLLILACQTNSTRLFPNFVFLDTPFNKHENWNPADPNNYLNEVATMGCRTRTFENVNGYKTPVGRGNISFTTMNLPRLAIEAVKKVKEENLSYDDFLKKVSALFLEKVRTMSILIAKQLKERFDYQKTALLKQFPFMVKNNVWKHHKDISKDEYVGNMINQGSLTIGFIGGHNAMKMIFGKGHGESDAAYDLLYQAVLTMNEIANQYKQKYNLNYSVIATPAEGLSGRFTRMDVKKYGVIPGVNDSNYYVNSFHVDVKQDISIFEKIKKEAPFHAITLGGHISYVELDGAMKYNIPVILKIVKCMFDNNIGYGSINHPVDVCLECQFSGIIPHACDKCQSNNIRRIRRITGYLTGDLNSWNSTKRSEEHDRVKHGINEDK